VATILQGFRATISDETSPYQISNDRILRFLDSAIDALSGYLSNATKETITITATDITNGYFTTSHDIQHIIKFYPAKNDWDIVDNRIYMVNKNDWSEGSIDVLYNKYYKRFDEEDRDDSYFDYPKRAEAGLILYALGNWMDEQSGMKADGSNGAIKSKSEHQMQVEYAVNGEGGSVTTGNQAREEAVKMWRKLPNAKSMIFSVSSYK
jgi:hypothetical protein